MKDIVRNPILYYIGVPLLVALWPLLVWGVYLPRAEKGLERQENEYNTVQPIMLEILTLDPDRASDTNDTAVEFNYASAVEKAASLCRIPPSKYRLSTAMPMKTGDRRSKGATVTIKEIDVVSLARFLSSIQVRWASLELESIKLTAKKGLVDVWDAEVKFKYYY